MVLAWPLDDVTVEYLVVFLLFLIEIIRAQRKSQVMQCLGFYELASASAPLVNGLLRHSPRDGAGSGTYFDDILPFIIRGARETQKL